MKKIFLLLLLFCAVISAQSIGGWGISFRATRAESSGNPDSLGGHPSSYYMRYIDSAGLHYTKFALLEDSLDITRDRVKYNYAGTWGNPSFTDNGDGSYTVGSGLYVFNYADSGGENRQLSTISGQTFTPSNDTVNYCVANYNGGTPVLQNIQNLALIDCIKIIPVYTVFREGTKLHYLNWGGYAQSLSEKLFKRIVKTRRFERESGLIISDSANRTVKVSSGVVWYGDLSLNMPDFTSAKDSMYLYSYSPSAWTKTKITQYNNSQYQGASGLESLSGAHYAVNWVYRNIENSNITSIILGTGNYTANGAISSEVPANIPLILRNHSILVGRIIILNGAETALSVSSAFSQVFTESSTAFEKTYRLPFTWNVSGTVAADSSTNYIGPIFIDSLPGQTVYLSKILCVLHGGDSVQFKLQRANPSGNNLTYTDITNFSGTALKTGYVNIDPADVQIYAGESIRLYVNNVYGATKDLTVTAFLDYTK